MKTAQKAADERRQDSKVETKMGEQTRSVRGSMIDGNARPAGAKTVRPEAERYNVTDRRRLISILEEYGVSVPGFDGLRSDSYEKQIAGRSLTELEGLYRTLLAPSGSYEEKQKLCPVWKKGGKGEDKLPDITTLSRIKERIRTEQKLTDMSGHLKALQAVVGSLTGLPVAERAVILQGLQALIAAELMGLSIEGGKVIDHLPAVDRVIRAASAQARGENMEAKARLEEKGLEFKNRELEFKQEQANAKAESGSRGAAATRGGIREGEGTRSTGSKRKSGGGV